jgi:hypothetical protein
VTNPQKVILAALAGIAVLIFTLLLGALAFFFLQRPQSPPVVVAQQAQAAPLLTTTASPLPATTATATSTPLPLPTATSTRVVATTTEPTETPLPGNCINNIINFETSGLVTNEEVQTYLRQTLPASHLDNCRVIEYQARLVGYHATPVAGSFTPMFRQIYVYETGEEFHTTENLLDTLIHEVGHNVHYNLQRKDWNLKLRWMDLYQQSKESFARDGLGFVSDYARFSEFEDFAETYRVYVRDPELLKFANPQKYEFMRQEAFEGREY